MEKILKVADKIAPFKGLRVKNNTQYWFDDELYEAFKLRELWKTLKPLGLPSKNVQSQTFV